MRDLTGRGVLLTGASTGLGPHIARRLHKEGARLTLSGRNLKALKALARELSGSQVITADLSQRGEAERLAEQAGEIDVLVANAGLPAPGRLEQLSIEQIDGPLEINLRAPIVLARFLLPGMLARRSGHLVFMASIAGKLPAPGYPLYSATKFGLRGFAHVLRGDLHGTGVSCSAICPTFVTESGMWAQTGLKAHPLVGDVPPQRVADAVATAIKDDRAEIVVAPISGRLGAVFGGAVPELAVTVARMSGATAVTNKAAEEHRAKR